MKIPSIAEVRKSLLALTGVLGMVAASGIIQGTLETRLTLSEAVIGAIATALVYKVPNAVAKPVGAHEQHEAA